MQFAQKLAQLEGRYEELTQQMADPAVIGDSDQYRKVTKAQSELSDVVAKYRERIKTSHSLAQARAMLDEKDPELRAMAQEEVAVLGDHVRQFALRLGDLAILVGIADD